MMTWNQYLTERRREVYHPRGNVAQAAIMLGELSDKTVFKLAKLSLEDIEGMNYFAMKQEMAEKLVGWR